MGISEDFLKGSLEVIEGIDKELAQKFIVRLKESDDKTSELIKVKLDMVGAIWCSFEERWKDLQDAVRKYVNSYSKLLNAHIVIHKEMMKDIDEDLVIRRRELARIEEEKPCQ